MPKGADVVCFSGDKLWEARRQESLSVKRNISIKMKKNQLTRALRIDKFTAATLELVLQEYV